MKQKIINSLRLFVIEILDIQNVFNSLSETERAELGKMVAFGLFVNGGYGALHGSILDIFVVFFTIYAIMKLIKFEKESKND